MTRRRDAAYGALLVLTLLLLLLNDGDYGSITVVHGLAAPTTVSRRDVLFLASSSSIAAVFLNTLCSSVALAADTNIDDNDDDSSRRRRKITVQGVATLAPNVAAAATAPTMDPSAAETNAAAQPAALYITCRPDRADNVPAAILSGTRGKPPPVLAARFAGPQLQFPFRFALDTAQHVTPEGASAADGNDDDWWWKDDNLVVSARWDSDGVAATRSPEDLVGRGLWLCSDSKDAAAAADISSQVVTVQLQGRGSFGKFATKKSS